MKKNARRELYNMREQGIDPFMLNDQVESNSNNSYVDQTDTLWDDDILFGPDDGYPNQSRDGRMQFDSNNRFREVEDRHY